MPVPKGTLHNHTRELVDTLMAAWRAGATYGELGKQFGLQKNMVAGIIHRNKEPGEKSARPFQPPAGGGSGPAPKRLPHLSGGHMPTGRTVVATAKMTPGARFRECQWIALEPSADDACKCGAATGATRVYCPKHEARAWRTVQVGEAAA